VHVGPGTLLLFLAWSSYSRVFLTGLDEEICQFGQWMCRVLEGC
jgi:hypothetical protein